MSQYLQKVSYPGPFGNLSGGEYLQALMKSDMFSKTEDMLFMGTNKGLMTLFKRDTGEGLNGMKKSNSADGHGLEVSWNLLAEQSGSFAALTENGDFAGPGRARYVRAVAPMRAHSGSIAITMHAEVQTRKKEFMAAALNAATAEQKSFLKTQAHNLRRILLGDGTGVIGIVKAVANSGSPRAITIESDPGVAIWPIPTDARFFFAGQLLAWSPDGTTIRGNGMCKTQGNVATKATIGQRDYNVIYLELSNGSLPSVGDYIVAGGRNNADSAYVASWRNEFLGLGAVLNPAFEQDYDGTPKLHGLAPATYSLWNPITHDFTEDGETQNITPDLLDDATELYLERNGEDRYPDFMASTHRLHKNYAHFLAKDVQYGGSVDNKGGTSQTGNTYNGGFGIIPWTIDRLMPDGEVWMGRKDACQYVWWDKPGFVPLDGGNMWRQSDVSSRKVAIYTMMGNFITTRRWELARFYGFTQASTWIK